MHRAMFSMTKEFNKVCFQFKFDPLNIFLTKPQGRRKFDKVKEIIQKSRYF